MPVPVPRHSKPVSHPVVKQLIRGDRQPNTCQTLTCTLSVPSPGLPPSLDSRDQRIDSLPTWRRIKPRRIWVDDTHNYGERTGQDFNQGLTAAGNASVIKGAHAEASIPPIGNLFESSRLPTVMSTDPLSASDVDADDDMGSEYLAIDDGYLDSQSQWNTSSSIAIDDDGITQNTKSVRSTKPAALFSQPALYDHHISERVASTPILLDQSPNTPNGPRGDSSPLQPITPFGLYIDRAVASEPQSSFGVFQTDHVPFQTCDHQDQICRSQCFAIQPTHQRVVNSTQEQLLPSAPPTVSPTASAAYRKLAEPLSEWVANYVWKVCTTGLNLPPTFTPPFDPQVATYSIMPPTYLASSVHSLLLSTLLQPSAIFLAIWYIVRLPVYFLTTPLGPEHTKEVRFRAALLGESYAGPEREAMETSAPFRLIVLGCMLANKWLDDHTFSNKTWHNISNIPIEALNKLESLTLDVLAYDLTVSAQDWSQWLNHISTYHSSLASPIHTQPISRPSTNPHSIIRKAIDEITIVPAKHQPQPIFVGLEERRQEKLEKERAVVTDISEINLDEDGPLREEYLPKRRISGAELQYHSHVQQSFGSTDNGVDTALDWERNPTHDHRPLPPPAKWSPAGDEPLYPEKNRVTGRYAAVQPPVVSYPAPYHPPVEVHSHYIWNSIAYPVKPQSNYEFDFSVVQGAHQQESYSAYTYIPQIPISHSRSQSLCYDQESLHSRNHARMYSQTGSEYQCSDIRLTAEYNLGAAMWRGANHYQYGTSSLAPIHNAFAYPPSWLRT